MRRSTRAITLTLIGTALAACPGCGSQPQDENAPPSTARRYWGGYHGGWGYYYGGGGRTYAGNAANGAPRGGGAAVGRGGFGADGHAAGGS